MPEPDRRKQKVKTTQSATDELWLFGRTTSMRGVPRIIKAESLPLKLVWSIAVVALLSFAVSQVVEIAVSYFDYEVYTSVQEMSFHPSKDKPVYPSITVCNQNPFSTLHKEELSGIISKEEYNQHVSRLAHCSSTTFLKTPHDKYLCGNLLSKEAYFQFLGPEKSIAVGHKLEEFIIDCKVLILSGLIYDKIPCRDLVNISLVQNVQYFNCFKLDITNDYFVSDGLIAGVSLVLHLGNTQGNSTRHKSQMDMMGAIITPHHPYMPAFPSLDGTLIPSGASSRIQGEIKQRIRLPVPYGTCKQTAEFEGYEKMKMCVAACMSQHIIQHCGCLYVKVAIEIPSYQNNNNKNKSSIPYCFDINSFTLTELNVQAKCVNHISNIPLLESCVDSCPQSCKEYQYSHGMSYSNWPSIWDLKQFYHKYIFAKPFEDHYKHLQKIIKENCVNNLDCYSKKLAAYKVIENNFLEVSYRLSDHRYLRLVDIPKSRIADICSKVGGVLNLWSGITVIVLLELFEMICRIFKNWTMMFRYGSNSSKTTIRDPSVSSRNRDVLV